MASRGQGADRQQREIKQQDLAQCSRLGASGVGAARGNATPLASDKPENDATWSRYNYCPVYLFLYSSGLIVSNRFPSNTLWFHKPGQSILKLKAKRSQHCRRNPCPGPYSVQQLLYFILIFFTKSDAATTVQMTIIPMNCARNIKIKHPDDARRDVLHMHMTSAPNSASEVEKHANES